MVYKYLIHFNLFYTILIRYNSFDFSKYKIFLKISEFMDAKA